MIVGAVMAILDTTVVSVALQALALEFSTSLDTIQWVSTGYMLALATVIPVTDWKSDRFGTKRFVWALVKIAVCVVPALFLPGVVRTVSSASAGDGDREDDGQGATPPVMLGH